MVFLKKDGLCLVNQVKEYGIFFFPPPSRGMKFENVQTLTDAISDIITDMRWGWSVFSFNTLKCL